MNAVDAALRSVRNEIPSPILEAVFKASSNFMTSIKSVDANVSELIIRDIVMPDISNTGQYIEINLDGCQYEEDPTDQYSRIYYIPDHILSGRELLTAHISVTPMMGRYYTIPPTGSYVPNNSGGGLLGSAARAFDSHSPIPRVGSAEIRVNGYNSVRVKDPGMYIYGIVIKAMVAFSDELNEIKPPYFSLFGELVLWATKRFIYKELTLTLDVTRVNQGAEFTRFKDVVDEYRDASQSYNDCLTLFKRSMVLNDDVANRDNYRSGGRWKV